MAKNILITGGTGLVGHKISELLVEKGYNVAHLSRDASKPSAFKLFEWDIKHNSIDPKSLDFADAIIHLAGANVSDGKWTKEQKEIIEKSRTESTQLLFDEIKAKGKKFESILCASASGYYGSDLSDQWKTEDHPAGKDFLAEVTRKWEEKQDQFRTLGIRTVQLRIGVVLSRRGGALPKLAMPIQFFVGAPLGNGNQYMPWIHIEDLAHMFVFALENEHIDGKYNAAAPYPVTNEEMMRQLAEVLNRPILPLNVPEFVIKLAVGEMGEVVTKGIRLSAEKIQKENFNFQYPELKEALASLY